MELPLSTPKPAPSEAIANPRPTVPTVAPSAIAPSHPEVAETSEPDSAERKSDNAA